MWILAGDIGGTKTRLALFSEGSYEPLELATFPSQEFADLESIIALYLEKLPGKKIATACFALAGPIKEGRCETTNIAWIVDSKKIKAQFNIHNVLLLNDLEAAAWSLGLLDEGAFCLLQKGRAEIGGNKAIISPGTGLGEAGLLWDGVRHIPFATEGGQTDLGPKDGLQIELVSYLIERYGHVSYERALSGRGIKNIFDFLKERKGMAVEKPLLDAMEREDPAALISKEGLTGRSEICVKTLDLFALLLGQEAGNLALKHLALGGLYLGGGIPVKLLAKLQGPLFLEGFLNKGHFSALLQDIPVRVILDEQASLKGAAACAITVSK